MAKQPTPPPKIIPNPDLHFLDSGAYSLGRMARQWAKETGHKVPEFYNSDKFWHYMESYVEFVKKYHFAIDVYANVDIMPGLDATAKDIERCVKLSRRSQEWLEARGLNPMPVIHYRSPLEVLREYIEDGYSYLGFGGLAGYMKPTIDSSGAVRWLSEAFRMICPEPHHKPVVKIHGFGLATIGMMIRFPWYSVDSTSWIMYTGFGWLAVPRKRKGEFVFTPDDLKRLGLPPKVRECKPWKLSVCTSEAAAPRLTSGSSFHYLSMTEKERETIDEWLSLIGVQYGDENNRGVSNDYYIRARANMAYWRELRERMPEFPQKFIPPIHTLMELEGIDPPVKLNYKLKPQKPAGHPLIIYYSGVDRRVIGPHVMYTYWDSYGKKKPHPGFRALVRARKNALRRKKK